MKPFNGFLLVLFFSLHYMSILSAISSTNMWKVESKKENEKGNGEKKILNGVNNKISKQRQKNTKKKMDCSNTTTRIPSPSSILVQKRFRHARWLSLTLMHILPHIHIIYDIRLNYPTWQKTNIHMSTVHRENRDKFVVIRCLNYNIIWAMKLHETYRWEILENK